MKGLAIALAAALSYMLVAVAVDGGASCRKIVRNFHNAWGNEEDYIWSYPAAQQARVRACLDDHQRRIFR